MYPSNEAADPLEKANHNCLFCFDRVSETCPYDSQQKILEKCRKYLHYTILGTINDVSEFHLLDGNQIVLFCEKCSRSTLELSGLIEQLEFIQKSIVEQTFTFSLGVLHRRRKFSATNTKDNGLGLTKFPDFDVSDLPDFKNDLEFPSSPQQPADSSDSLTIPFPDICSATVVQEPVFHVPGFVNQHFNSALNFGEIKIENELLDEEIPVNINVIEPLGFSSPSMAIVNEESNKIDTLSKSQITNSPLPVLRLERLNNPGCNDTLLKGHRYSKENDQEKQLTEGESIHDVALSVVQGTIPSPPEKSEPNSSVTAASSSDILVNLSTIAIKIETEEKETVFDKIEEIQIKKRRDVKKQHNVKNDITENRFRCKFCNKTFMNKSTLIYHERRHNNREKPFPCNICDKSFSHKHSLILHKRLHTGERLLVCFECEKQFVTKQQLKHHERIHTGEKPFSCSDCNKRFAFKSALICHQRIHTGENPFFCSTCDKGFSSKQSLIKHGYRHTLEQTFSCNICNKRLTTKQELKNHQQLHIGNIVSSPQNESKCEKCEKVLCSKNSLWKHMQVHKKPYSCPICKKKFELKLNLESHVAKHADEIRYKCDLCEFETSEPTNMKYHRITAH